MTPGWPGTRLPSRAESITLNPEQLTADELLQACIDFGLPTSGRLREDLLRALARVEADPD